MSAITVQTSAEFPQPVFTTLQTLVAAEYATEILLAARIHLADSESSLGLILSIAFKKKKKRACPQMGESLFCSVHGAH